MSITGRLLYVDCLRGFAMLMVVYSHVLTFAMGGIVPSALGEFMRVIMLPLFFFISGFCAYKDTMHFSRSNFMEQILSKIRSILIPTIIMFLLFMVYSHNNILHYATSYDKSGYWFTWVLFQVLVIYYLTVYVAGKINNVYLKIIVICFPLVVMWLFAHSIGFSNELSVIFEWVKLKQYYVFFLVGVFLRQFEPYVIKFIERPFVNLLLFIISVLSYIVVGGGNVLVFSILILWYLFYSMNSWMIEPFRWFVNTLSLIGKNTLAVYFIHFFLLFSIPIIPEWLEMLKNDSVFGTHSCDSFVELIIVGVISILISYMCVFVGRILRAFPLVHTICLGPINSNV